jgi:hypothetical protein
MHFESTAANCSPVSCLTSAAASGAALMLLDVALASWAEHYFVTPDFVWRDCCSPRHQQKHDDALQLLQAALDRPCTITQISDDEGLVTTCDDDGLIGIDSDDLGATCWMRVQLVVKRGCLVGIQSPAGHACSIDVTRALAAAKARLGLTSDNGRQFFINNETAPLIVILLQGVRSRSSAHAPRNLFAHIALHVALGLKHALYKVDCHSGLTLARPNVMPFVDSSDVALHALDEGMCGLQLVDALCCFHPIVLALVFKSALAASKHVISTTRVGGGTVSIDVCEPWPNFLMRESVQVSDRSPVINANSDVASNPAAAVKPGASIANQTEVLVDHKMRQKWQDCLTAALLAVHKCSSRLKRMEEVGGSAAVEDRVATLKAFLDVAHEALGRCSWLQGGMQVSLQEKVAVFERVCHYALRTLPFFPVLLQTSSFSSFSLPLVWFGRTTPWEDRFEEDKLLIGQKKGHTVSSQYFYHGTKGFSVYRCDFALRDSWRFRWLLHEFYSVSCFSAL